MLAVESTTRTGEAHESLREPARALSAALRDEFGTAFAVFDAVTGAEVWGANGPPAGWLLAVNKTEDRGPRTEDRTRRASEGSSLPLGFQPGDVIRLAPFAALLELDERASARFRDLKELLLGLTHSLTAALDAKDSFTYGHSERVARIAVELGRELRLSGSELSDLYLAGLLHDVGRLGIRDDVLRKVEPLTAEEFEHIKQHVTIGYSILADLQPLRSVLPAVLYHHESFDGSGYPDGLAGEAIPLLARILAVADAYDAMTTARPYRPAMTCRQVEEILEKGKNQQWDGRVLEAFWRCRGKIHTIRQRGLSDSFAAALEDVLRLADRDRGKRVRTEYGVLGTLPTP
jgi:HD-GYP domain-containing protein (c-di-GMP phosphodiesterase class II)